MSTTHFNIIHKSGTAEVVEKKSRFIATTYPLKSLDEAGVIIEAVKKKYWDAKHNCYAYVYGDNDENQKCSDDGEPSGTAGKPILEMIHANNLHNCLVIVTRYFGGILLGTGGLVRAYSSASRQAVENSIVKERIYGKMLMMTMEYGDFDKINYIIEKNKSKLEDIEYTDKITAKVGLDYEQYEEFMRKITESSLKLIKIEEQDMWIYR